MVLSNKRLKQKVRSLLGETLAIEQSGRPLLDAGKSEEINQKLQSLKQLLGTRNQRPRREKRKKKQPLSGESKPVETSEEAKNENKENGGNRKKRKREGGVVAESTEDRGVESSKKQKKKQKKQKKKKDKNKKTDKEKDTTEKDNERVNGDVNEGRAAEETKVGVSKENDDGAKKVYVGGIPYYSTEDDIRSFFDGCGTVTEVDCMKFPESGKFRGIAFLTFKTEAAAGRALALDGADMGGLYLKVQPYKCTRTQKSDFHPEVVDGYNRIYVGNLSWDITEDELRKFFSNCSVSSIRFGADKVTGEFKGYAHVDFGDSVSLAMALKLDQKVVCGRPIRIRCAVPKKETGKESSPKPPTKTPESTVQKEMVKETSSKPVSKIAESGTHSGNSKKKRQTCYVCGVPGHISSSCPQKGATENTGAQT